MRITGDTSVLGIFGRPVTHSLSPLMQNRALEAMGVNGVYVPFEVEPERLREAVDGMRAMGIGGVNITIPHKESVMEFLDEVSKDAADIGAVNTVVNREGRLTGYNTDGEGYITSLKEETSAVLKGWVVVVIGAGGAARGIATALAGEGPATLVIANRTRPRADALASVIKERFENIDVFTTGLDTDSLATCMIEADLVVNATSLGMTGMAALEVPLDRLPPHAIVSDIVYKPLKTPFLRAAEELDLAIHSGLGMLVCQGALSLQLWTGMEPPKDVMRKVLEEALR